MSKSDVFSSLKEKVERFSQPEAEDNHITPRAEAPVESPIVFSPTTENENPNYILTSGGATTRLTVLPGTINVDTGADTDEYNLHHPAALYTLKEEDGEDKEENVGLLVFPGRPAAVTEPGMLANIGAYANKAIIAVPLGLKSTNTLPKPRVRLDSSKSSL